jgi:hypothetical protein
MEQSGWVTHSWRLPKQPKPAGPQRKRKNRDRSLEKKGEQVRRAAQRASIGQGTSVPLDRAEAEASHRREAYEFQKAHVERLRDSLLRSHQVLFLEPRVVFASAWQFLMGLAKNDEDTATGAPSRGAIGCHSRGTTGAPITAASCSARWPGSVAGELHGIINSSGGAVTNIPQQRWDVSSSVGHLSEAQNDSARYGGFLDGTERVDNFCFGASSVEASVVDPQQRLLLEAGLLYSFAGAHLRRAALMHSGLGVLLVGTKHPTTTATATATTTTTNTTNYLVLATSARPRAGVASAHSSPTPTPPLPQPQPQPHPTRSPTLPHPIPALTLLSLTLTYSTP